MRRGLVLVLLAGSLAAPASTGAVPVDPDQVVPLRQPDGRTLEAHPFGDEWNHGLRTRNGYTIVRNRATRRWEYAVKERDGGLRASGVRAGTTPPRGTRKRLRDLDGAPRPASLSPPRRGLRQPRLVPAVGTQHSLVILVQFNDQASLGTTPAQWASRFFGASSSLRDYYQEASYGKLDIAPAAESNGTANDGIVGWLTLDADHPQASDLKDNQAVLRAQLTVNRAVTAADPYVNYAQYDTNSDGVITRNELHITVIPAGWEASAQCGSPSVWGHKFSTGAVSPVADGKDFYGDYTMFGEEHCSPGGSPGPRIAQLGIIAHEMGHDLGWPDLYDVDGSSRGGVGYWSVMASGSWLAAPGHLPGADPPSPDAFLKSYQSWSTPSTAVSAATPLRAAATNPDSVRLLANPNGVDWDFDAHSGTGEYFLVENRQPVGYDSALPGCGIVVWHVDESRDPYRPNADDDRRLLNLVEADDNAYPYQASDIWTGARTLSDATTPGLRLYSGAASGLMAGPFGACADTMSPSLSTGGGGGGAAIANDGFADASALSAPPVQRTLPDTSPATTEAAEPTVCAGVGNTVWYRWTPAATMNVTAETTGSNFDTVLAVHRGSASSTLGGLTPVTCNDDIGGGNPQSRVAFTATPGQTYWLQVGGYKGASGVAAAGALTLKLDRVPTPPSNDGFAGADSASPLPFSRTAIDTQDATTEAGEPAPACAPAGGSVWFKHVATEDGTLIADTVDSDYDTVLAAYRGTALNALTPMACQDDITPSSDTGGGDRRSRISVDVAAGETYYFQVGGYRDGTNLSTGSLSFHLARAAAAAPGNDTFDGAVAATALPFAPATLDTTTATAAGEPDPSCGSAVNTVWYRYAAPGAGHLVASTAGSDFDTVLAVHRGTSLAALTEVACSDDVDANAGDRLSRTEFDVAGGQTYYLQVGGKAAAGAADRAGHLALRLEALDQAPANDARTAPATVATLPFTRTGVDTRMATEEPDEPSPALAGKCTTIGATVWYRYTPAGDEALRADTVGSGFDTVLAVYQGSPAALDLVDCNDDVDPPTSQSDTTYDLRSRLEVPLDGGVTYYIQAGGYRSAAGAATGDLTLRLERKQPPPANDARGAASTTALPVHVSGLDTRGATTEPGEPAACSPIAATVWYRFTPAADMDVVAQTTGSNYDTVLAIYEGGALTPAGCSDDIDTNGGNLRSRVSFVARAGRTYWLQAGAYRPTDGSAPAPGTLKLDVTGSPRPGGGSGGGNGGGGGGTSGGGGAPGGTNVVAAPPLPDTSAPALGSVRLASRRLGTKGRRRRTLLRFTLSEAAQLELTATRAVPGRRRGGRCRRAAPGARGGRACTLYVKAGSRRFAGHAGANAVTFDGSLSGRRLAPGRYRASVVAVDAAGNRSAPRTFAFTVVRGR